MKTLVLCRHAKSDWSQGLADFNRPLNERGNRDAPRMGTMLSKAGFKADYILTSPATRARATAESVAKKIGYKAGIRSDQRIYDDGHGTLVSIVQDLPQEADTVMIFGHNPTMEQAVSYLLQSQGSLTMPTCAMACLEIAVNSWQELHPRLISLKWLLIPKMIP